MIGKLESPMLLTSLQPWALLHCVRIKSETMALVQCVATMARGGMPGSTPPGALPVLLPDLPPGASQRPTPGDAPRNSNLQTPPPALALPRPGPTLGPCGSPTLPLVPTIRQDDTSPCGRTAGPGAPRATTGSRTPTLPLLTNQPSARWTLLPGLQSPSAPAVQQPAASSPPPRTPPAPLYRTRPAGLNPATSPTFATAARPAAALATRSTASMSPTAVASTASAAASGTCGGPIPFSTASASSFATSALSDLTSATSSPITTTTTTSSSPVDTTAAGAAAPAGTEGSGAPAGAPGGPAGDSVSSSSSPGSGGPQWARGASVDPREAAKFAALAASWWRTAEGPFAPLHALNPARVRFVRQSLAALMGLDGEAPEPLAGLRVLDVGCGGGILSEALARLGAEVHGIDVTSENVEVARFHAGADPRVAARVRYDVISAEDLAASGTAPIYDVVIASEVLEHVSRPHVLLPVLASLLAPPAPEEGRPAGGALIVSTLNRTPASWGLAIVGAEYITGVVPRGTHTWRKFIMPEELAVMAGACGLRVWHAAGMTPLGARLSLTSSWQLSEDLSVNYIATLVRSETGGGGSGGGSGGEEAAGEGASQEQQQS